MSNGTVVVCETCGVEVDPSDADVVMLVQWMRLDAFGDNGPDTQWVEGVGA